MWDVASNVLKQAVHIQNTLLTPLNTFIVIPKYVICSWDQVQTHKCMLQMHTYVKPEVV